MSEKPTYEELEQRIKELKQEADSRKLVEEALLESETRYRTLAQYSQTGIYIHIGGLVKFVNNSFAEILGYTPEEIVGRQYWEFVHPGDREMVKKISLDRARGEAAPADYEFRHLRKDGKTVWVHNLPTIIQYQGQTANMGNLAYINERKRVEEALQESEEKHRGLIEGLDEAIYHMSLPDGKYAYMSPAARKVFGYSAEEFMENPLFMRKVIHPGFAEYFKEQWADLIVGKVPPAYKYKILDPEGNERWIVQSNTGIFDDGGNIIAIEGLCRDITKGVQAEKELRESEELYKEAQRVAHIGHWELNPEIGTPVWSDEIFRIFGLIPQEGEPSFTDHETHLHPDDWPLLNKAVTLASAEGTPFDIIFRIVRPDGEIRWMHSIGTTSKDEKDRVLKLFGTAQDITDRKRAEEALRESEKRLIEAQHIANIGDFTWDVETDEVTWSDGLFDLLQYDKSEGIDYARVNAEIHHPDDLERVTQWLNVCIASGKAELTPNEYRLVRKDGNILYVRTLGVIEREVGKSAKVFATIQDITEKKQMEGEIRESEEKIRVLYNNSPDMSASVSPHDASILQCNETLLNKTGYSREEVIGSPIFKIYHNDCMAEVKKAFQEFVETGVIKDRELTVKRKDGSKIDVSLNVNAIRGQTGEIKYSVSSWRDITERKQAELKLIKAKHKAEEGEKRFRAFIEQSPVAIALFNLDGTGMYANQKYLDVLGLKSLGDFIGRPAHEYFAPQFREESKERSRRRLLGLPVPVEFESIALHSDGSEFPMQVAVGAIKLSADETVNISFIANISDRKQAEEALRESEEKLQAIFKANPDPVVVYDTEGYPQYLNPAFTELFGWSLDELGGRRIPFVPEDQREIVAATINKIYTYDKAENLQTRRLTKQGDTIDVIMSAATITGPKGKPIGLVVNLKDISEQIKLESQLQQAQKMEAVGTLAGGIAHDFNNLLMAIQGRASIMLMKKDSSHPDIRHLKGIEDNVESAADLTKQLLGFARGGKYEVKPTDLNEVVKKQNRMFGRTKKEITIRGKYEENLWSVEVDRGQIEQVLLNLYVNAWQAMPGGGDLYLETKDVTLDETDIKPFAVEPGGYVKISVTDTGVGMDKATREKIFEPFFTTKEMGRGTGLGLASAYGIIKNHGGFINVYSEKGHGTTFNVYLPASEKKIIEEKKPAGDTLRGTETVLFVDDEDMIIEVAEELFEELGYKVLTTGSGREAIETYEKNKERIDMVLLDMVMPDMSGGETYDKLKEINPDVKVLLASGYSMNGTATEIMDRGCNGFIQKPFKMKELSQKLREILDGK